MSWFSKIVIVILLVLSFFFIKEKFFGNVDFRDGFSFFNKKAEKIEQEDTNITEEPETPKDKPKSMVYLYFLSLDSAGGSVFTKVEREYSDTGEDKLTFAIKELFKGPNYKERSAGAYNEIPKGTKLVGIERKGNSIIINLNSDFQYGGGTDSIYSRLRQLIKTLLANTSGENVYLYLDGKQANVIGGEGIMVSQPLSETSLDE